MSKRRRYFDNNEASQTSDSGYNNTETIDGDVAEQSAPDIYSKEDPIEEVLEDAINKVSAREYPTILETPKTLDNGKMKVKSRRLRLREAASKVGKVVGLLEHDTVISIDKNYKNDTWYRVIDESGNEKGFVMKEFVSPYI